MAVYLDVTYQGQPSRLALTAIDRKRLHGFTKRVALDANGNECATAHLTRDGRALLMRGSTADLYTNERGDSVPRADLMPIDGNGRALKTLAPTTGGPQEIEGSVAPHEILDHIAGKAYALAPETFSPAFQSVLVRGVIFRVAYRPRKTTQQTSAFIFANDAGIFLVQTQPCGFEFVGPGQVPVGTDGWADDDEFDFDQHERWSQ